ncbi:hypothetical protein HAV15_001528 [Penicillium sp. str. |nr:hypothetical protein HAV15_001528 [Penicillium sp. str. \
MSYNPTPNTDADGDKMLSPAAPITLVSRVAVDSQQTLSSLTGSTGFVGPAKSYPNVLHILRSPIVALNRQDLPAHKKLYR